MMKKALLAVSVLSIIALAAACMLPFYIALFTVAEMIDPEIVRRAFKCLGVVFGLALILGVLSRPKREAGATLIATLAMACILLVLTGCSVNVVVAPHATVAVDSQNSRADLRATQTHDVYEAACLPDSDNCL